jgi:multiple sugar transport system permease protein
MLKKLDRVGTLYVPLLLLMLFTMLPFYWTLATSFKREGDILKTPVRYVPQPFTWHNYVDAWNNVGFSVFFKNSLFVALGTVVLVLLCSTLCGYAISRFRFKGKNALMVLLISTQFVPGAMLLGPLFTTFNSLRLTNHLISLVITYTTFELPFNAILMSGFVKNIPEQLEEAAMVDGCSRFKSVFYVILPILLPGLVATTVFTFIGAWNEFLFALMFISKSSSFTIPVGLRFMQGEFNIEYGSLAAGSMIAVLPAVALFALVQRFLVEGMGAGAVKG